ncbi:NEL-type E3 ubiquitin ligase domain-containing protein [Pseudomonas sp. McL0111]|uniref:NEL-type E3 ubiquitin ligase domain-containing protein n=1 Tax=Pseudomonas sp. McL0111 TaxID=3457357 RepID=UPI00403E3E34
MSIHLVTEDTKASDLHLVRSALLEATTDLDSADVLHKTLPDWLLKASPVSLATLDQTAHTLQVQRAKLEPILKGLRPLKGFCIELLTIALEKKWSVSFNVEKDYLELSGVDCGCVPGTAQATGVQGTPVAKRTLLEAAMQNFAMDEEQVAGFPSGSVVRVLSTPDGVAGLTPAAFAGVCRELNLGLLYQQHFAKVFGFQSVNGKVVASGLVSQEIRKVKKLLFQLDMQLARLKDDITPAAQATVQRLSDADGLVNAQTLHYQGRPLIMQGIEIHDACIWGVVVFSVRSVQFYADEWCLVYMPGEPHRPLYEYPSFNAFKEYLTLKLNVRSYKDYFANCLDEDNKVDFMTTFANSRQLGFVKALSINVSLLDFMVQSHIGKLQIDARTLIVPTADVDEEAREQRLVKYLEVGVTVATLAGFFVPVVGQLMMGVAVGQLLAEVYEGVEDWREGDKDEAFAHLLNIAQNVALMGVAAAGQKVVGSVVRRTLREHPEFFAGFTAILKSGGQSRLLRSRLESYELPASLGNEAVAGADGVFLRGGQSCVRIDQRVYAVEFEPVSKTWRIRHPLRSEAFMPTVVRHPEGGWRLPHEQSEGWTGAYTLKRMDPRLNTLEDATLEKTLRIIGAPVSEMQRLSVENLPLPARLREALVRLQLDAQLRQFISAMERAETSVADHAPSQLHALPALSGWPEERYIKVLNDEQEISATYPPTLVDDDALSVIVTEGQLARGELLETVVNGLYPQEVEALLGVKAAKSDVTKLLAKKLGEAVKLDRRPLFEQLYRHSDQWQTDDGLKLRRVLPNVPSRQAQALISRATSVERLHVRKTGRVPMRLAQQLREAEQTARLDRALAGWILPEVTNADSEKLAVQLLPRLHGWNTSLRLELREGTINGRLLEAVGEDTSVSALKCTVVKTPQGYEVFDGERQSLGAVASGPTSLCEAILKAIPPSQRIAAGFSDPQASDYVRLRGKLLDLALDTREDAVEILASGKLGTARLDDPCIQGDSPGETSSHPRALVRKVTRLYPRFSETQARSILDGLGSDQMSRALEVKRLQRVLKRLRDVLDAWSEDENAMKALGGDLSEVREGRRLVADLVEDSWRQITQAVSENGLAQPTLTLEGMRVGKLPVLPADLTFDHVKQVSLKNMELDNDVVYFLKAFKQVESLELDRNRISLLPEVISHMPALKRLSLAKNQLKLTEQTLRKLSELRTLEVLNLSDNPLGATPDVGKMFDLRFLSVRETRATELPKGLARLPNLDRVDLRDNDIRELPDWLFSSPRRFSETINLRHNPLTDSSNERLKQYRDSVGSGMGYIEDDITRLNEQAARALWLPEGAGETFTRRNAIWTALKDDPQADGLFRLLSELIHTADSRYIQEDMTRRVWNVLNACESNSALREQVLELAANPINCTDSAALNFSHLEVAAEIDRVAHARTGVPLSAASLLKLGRGLFRLDQLDGIAREHMLRNPAVDPLEVSLAYRTGLADHFDLPGQPRHMRYASLSGVTASALETAKNQVSSAELSPALLKYLVQQPFWSDYLKDQFPRQFDTVSETYSTQMDTVFDQASRITTASYLTQMDAIKVAREDAENTVLERLTEQALRTSALGICAIPSD